MSAIKYFHSKNIVHRDLKLDNIIIIMDDCIEESRAKLIDFGMSKLTESMKTNDNKDNMKIHLSTFCGTIDFISPEVLEGKIYDNSTDMWSVGVIAYFMLGGFPPFMGKTDKEVQKNIITCNWGFDDPIWDTISKDAKDWIDNCLELDPSRRLTADQAIQHKWLASHKDLHKLNIEVLMNLHSINTPSKLLYELLVLFCQFLNDEDIKIIRETF